MRAGLVGLLLEFFFCFFCSFLLNFLLFIFSNSMIRFSIRFNLFENKSEVITTTLVDELDAIYNKEIEKNKR